MYINLYEENLLLTFLSISDNILFFLDVCQGYTECISEGRHGMCKVSKEGTPVCICKNGWTGENCDQKIDPMRRRYISPKLNVIRRYKQPSNTR